jgi:hypothetical protein
MENDPFMAQSLRVLVQPLFPLRTGTLLALIILGGCGTSPRSNEQEKETPIKTAEPGMTHEEVLVRSDPEAPKDLLGCWLGQDDPTFMIRFEPTKCAMMRKGKLQFYRAKYEPGKVMLAQSVFQLHYEYKRIGESLVLTSTVPITFKKASSELPQLQIQPLILGVAAKISEDQAEQIRRELARRRTLDQEVRHPRDPSLPDEVLAKEMWKVDAENTSYLEGVVKELGWVDAVRFGAAACNDAFLLVQHSQSLPLMTTVLPKVKEDVTSGRIGGQTYALLYDRTHLELGERQRFGTQMARNPAGDLVIPALEDREKVDQYRKEVGMGPISDYLRSFGHGGKKTTVIFEDW